MAHNLATIGGRVAMAYQGETPWHQLGTRFPSIASIEQALTGASLDWTVRLEDLALVSDGRKVGGSSALASCCTSWRTSLTTNGAGRRRSGRPRFGTTTAPVSGTDSPNCSKPGPWPPQWRHTALIDEPATTSPGQVADAVTRRSTASSPDRGAAARKAWETRRRAAGTHR